MSSRGWQLIAFVAAITTLVAAVVALATGQTAAALTLLGALAVAGVAAWSADQRLGRQLAAAAERHERELSHDREMREWDRAHDRKLADLADLRRIVDDTMVTLQRCAAEVRRLSSLRSVLTGNVNVEITPTTAMHARRALDEASEATREAALALRAQHARLRVRMGADDALVVSIGAAAEEALNAYSYARAVESDGRFAAAATAFQEQASRSEELVVQRTGAIVFDARRAGT